jgi:hypothetical protein
LCLWVPAQSRRAEKRRRFVSNQRQSLFIWLVAGRWCWFVLGKNTLNRWLFVSRLVYYERKLLLGGQTRPPRTIISSLPKFKKTTTTDQADSHWVRTDRGLHITLASRFALRGLQTGMDPIQSKPERQRNGSPRPRTQTSQSQSSPRLLLITDHSRAAVRFRATAKAKQKFRTHTKQTK